MSHPASGRLSANLTTGQSDVSRGFRLRARCPKQKTAKTDDNLQHGKNTNAVHNDSGRKAIARHDRPHDVNRIVLRTAGDESRNAHRIPALGVIHVRTDVRVHAFDGVRMHLAQLLSELTSI
jgi:hypothetical protein